ncbi:hypothetical protein ZWY2020_044363 [Hordeum vulgare]|nr:hypothetical protein ZWY2020_044363 [Hordeum vulgare]
MAAESPFMASHQRLLLLAGRARLHRWPLHRCGLLLAASPVLLMPSRPAVWRQETRKASPAPSSGGLAAGWLAGSVAAKEQDGATLIHETLTIACGHRDGLHSGR